jgi:PleD family two-component response regulator
MGIASLASLGTRDAESLIRAADDALYTAKAAGKNRIVAADEVSKPAPI